jgi:hypothetical protein
MEYLSENYFLIHFFNYIWDMIGILTGDIVNSRKLSSEIWMDGLKELLNV